jgi:hypothetical protein
MPANWNHPEKSRQTAGRRENVLTINKIINFKNIMIMESLAHMLTVGIVFYFTYITFELFVRKKERMSMIEKMDKNLAPPDSSILNNRFGNLNPLLAEKSLSGLRTGCLLIGLGLGLFTGILVCFYMKNSFPDMSRWESDGYYFVAYGSSVMFFGGLGLIVSFLMERRLARKKKE